MPALMGRSIIMSSCSSRWMLSRSASINTHPFHSLCLSSFPLLVLVSVRPSLWFSCSFFRCRQRCLPLLSLWVWLLCSLFLVHGISVSASRELHLTPLEAIVSSYLRLDQVLRASLHLAIKLYLISSPRIMRSLGHTSKIPVASRMGDSVVGRLFLVYLASHSLTFFPSGHIFSYIMMDCISLSRHTVLTSVSCYETEVSIK